MDSQTTRAESELERERQRLLEQLLADEGLDAPSAPAISPRDPSAPVPLTFAQEVLWLLAHFPYYQNWLRMKLFYSYCDKADELYDVDPDWRGDANAVNARTEAALAIFTQHLRDQLRGRPDLLEKCTPKYPPMARRIVVDNGWLAALTRPNVILVTDPIQDRERGVAPQRHQPGIAQRNGALGSARVLVFPDRDQTLAFHDQAPISGGIGRTKTQHRDGLALHQRLAQPGERARLHQRRVGEHHQDIVRAERDRVARRQHRMGGAAALGLHEDFCRRHRGCDRRRDLVLSGPDHHGGRVRRFPHGRHHMRHKRTAADRVQDLRARGAHSRPLARRQHDRQAGPRAHSNFGLDQITAPS